MKVCTDACLFGASIAYQLPEMLTGKGFEHFRILDIGAGTGLLSLMLAQSTPAIIHAVEIDEKAAAQAQQNFEASPWHQSMQMFCADIKTFTAPDQKRYDFIITNPPFFSNDLKSNDAARNVALHSDKLSLEVLLAQIKRLLSSAGYFAILLPYHRTSAFEMLAANEGFFLKEKILVSQTTAHAYFRSILIYSATAAATTEFTIAIQNEQRQYTPAFISLLKEYYLHL